MNIKIFLGGIFLATMLLWGESASAQKAVLMYKDEDLDYYNLPASAKDCYVLDCSDIDSSRLLTYKIYNNSSLYTHTETSSLNKVYKKLLVDLNPPYSDMTHTYDNAIIQVKKSNEHGHSNWRLPTQRELALIWCLITVKDIEYYWAATGDSKSYSQKWCINFGYNEMVAISYSEHSGEKCKYIAVCEL